MFSTYLNAQKSEDCSSASKGSTSSSSRKRKSSSKRRRDISSKKPKNRPQQQKNSRIAQDVIDLMEKTPLPTKVDGGLFPGGAGISFVHESASSAPKKNAAKKTFSSGGTDIGGVPVALDQVASAMGFSSGRGYTTVKDKKPKGLRVMKQRSKKRSGGTWTRKRKDKSAFDDQLDHNADKEEEGDDPENVQYSEFSELANFIGTDVSEGGSTEEEGDDSKSRLEDIFGDNVVQRNKRAEARSQSEEDSKDSDFLREALEIRQESMSSERSRHGEESSESSTQEIVLCSNHGGNRMTAHLDNGGEMVPFTNDPKSMSLREEKFGRSGDPRTCFLCLFGNVQYDSMVSSKLQILWDMLQSNYFSMTDTRGLAAASYAYYYEEIYQQGKAEGLDLPVWSEEGMYIHITQHMGDPRIFLGESIKDLSMLKRVLQNMAFEEDDEGVCKPNVKVISEIRMLTKQIREMYMSDPQAMFGYCEAFKADTSSMHRLAHMSRVKVHTSASIQSSKGTFS